MSNRFYKLTPALLALVVVGTVPAVVVPARPQSTPASAIDSEVKESAGRVDEVFAAAWKEAGVEPLELAEPLLVTRRLSLALAGTVPSLEEIRALEKLPAEQQIESHLEHLLSDRRYADYFAERLARAFVG